MRSLPARQDETQDETSQNIALSPQLANASTGAPFIRIACAPHPRRHVSHEAPTSKVSRVRRRRAGGAIEDKKIIRTVKCRGYAFCGERGDSSPPEEVIGVATLEVMVKDIAMKQS